MGIPRWPWFALNTLRLTGCVALSWLIVVQFILLGKDTQEMANIEVQDGDLYHGTSSVPVQAGSGFFMVKSRTMTVIGAAAILMGQLGLPEMWLHERVPWLGPSSSPFWLAIGELWLSTQSQRHKVPDIHLIPAWILFGVSLTNVLLAIALWILSRRLPPNPAPALIFNFTQRLMYFRPPPLVYTALLPDGNDSINPDEQSASSQHLDDRRWREQYPTFTGRGLGDPEAAIPKSLLHTDEEVIQNNRKQIGKRPTVAARTITREEQTSTPNAGPPERSHAPNSAVQSLLPTSRPIRKRPAEHKERLQRGINDPDQVVERPPRGLASLPVTLPRAHEKIARKQSAIAAVNDLRSSFQTPPARTEGQSTRDTSAARSAAVEGSQGDKPSLTKKIPGHTSSSRSTSIAERRGSVVTPALRLRTPSSRDRKTKQDKLPVTAPPRADHAKSRHLAKQLPRSSMAPKRTTELDRARSAPAHRSVRFEGLPAPNDDDVDADHPAVGEKIARLEESPHAMPYNSDSSAYSGIAGSVSSVSSSSPPLTAIPPPMIARVSSNVIDPHMQDGERTPRGAATLTPPARRQSSSTSQSARARMIVATMETPRQVPEAAPKSAPMLGPTYLDGSSDVWDRQRRPSSASLASTFSGLSGWSYQSSEASIRRRSSGDTSLSSPEEGGFWAQARKLTAVV